jgi:Family of unknown function (DUF6510)
MDQTNLMVDGNAVAGILGEVFVHEMTTARVACNSCGGVEPIGAEHAFVQAPGIVLRCCHCEDVLLVITRPGGRYLLGFKESKWIQIG